MKTMHKMKRKLKGLMQVRLCKPNENESFAENLSYRWKGVTCKRCLKLGGK